MLDGKKLLAKYFALPEAERRAFVDELRATADALEAAGSTMTAVTNADLAALHTQE